MNEYSDKLSTEQVGRRSRRCPVPPISPLASLWTLRFAAVVALSLLVLLGGRSRVEAAAFNSTGTGDWTTSLGGTPGPVDTVTILTGHTVTVTTAVSVAGLTVASGGTLVVSSTGSLTVGASNLAVTGTLTNNGALTVTGAAAATSPGTITNNATASVTGALSGTGSWIQGVSATVTLLNAVAPSISTFNATTNAPNTTNYALNSGAAQAIGAFAYSNLTLSGSGNRTGVATSIGGTFTLAGTATYTVAATFAVTGDLNVQGGTLTIPNFIVTITGNTTISGGTITLTTLGTAKTFTGDVTINGGTWLNNTAVVPVTIGGNLTYSAGTFTSGTGVYTLSGTNKQITGPLTIAAATVTGAGQTITGANSITALTVNTPGTLTNTGTLTLLGAGATMPGTGSFINGPGAALNYEGTVAPAILDAPAGAAPLLLSVTGLSTGYGRSTVLREIALEAHAGEIVCVLGRNGAGKTTLLKSLIGVLPAFGGRIGFKDSDIAAWPSYKRARAGIGYVPQGRGIFPQLSVMENLEIGLEPVGGKDTGQTDEVFALFPVLKEMAGRTAGVLSGGQQQQLAIGRALMGRPSLLLLDEPTEGIQPNIVDEIEGVIGSLRGRMAVLLVEQFLSFALAHAERCYVMERGEFTMAGPPADLDRAQLHEALSL